MSRRGKPGRYQRESVSKVRGVDERRRVLVVSDDLSLYTVICRALRVTQEHDVPASPDFSYDVDSAACGEEAARQLERALAERCPYKLAFVDLTSAIEGLETVRRLWKVQPTLQIVICAAGADCSWEGIVQKLGESDCWVTLKTPAEGVEIRQLAGMIFARQHAEEESKTNRAWHEVQFEATQDAVIIWDELGRVYRANPAAVKLLGGEKEQRLVGLSYGDLTAEYQPDGRLSEKVITKYRDLIQQRGVLDFEWRSRSLTGVEFDLLVHATTMRFPDATLVHSTMREITELKAAERARRETEELYHSLVSASPDAIILISLQGFVVFGSARALRVFGLKDASELVGSRLVDWACPEEKEAFEADLQRLNRRGNLRDLDRTLLRKDQTRFSVDINAAVLRDSDGCMGGAVLILRDTTARKRERVELRRSVSQLRATLQSTADGILVMDRGGRLTGYNQRFIDIFNVPMEILEAGDGHALLDYLKNLSRHPEEILARVNAILAEPQANSSDLIEFADGRSIEWFSCPQWIDGEPVARVWSCRDVTRTKQTERALMEQKLLLEAMLNAIPAPVFYKDVQGCYLNCNPAFLELMQLPREKVIGTDIGDVTIKSHAEWVKEKDVALLLTGGSMTYETEHPRQDGSKLQVVVTKGTFSGADGRTAGLVGIILDITERKRAEEKLRRTTERLRLLWQAVQQSPASVLVTDAAGNIQYVNPKFTEITGYSADEVMGLNPRLLRSGKTPRETYEDLWTTITSGQNWRGSLCNRIKNGKLVWESVLITPIKDDQGRVMQYLALKEDITALKKAEKALRTSNTRLERAIVKAEKLKVQAEEANLAKSQFLANMSHEIRTPMNSIIGMTGLLLNSPLSADQRKRAEVVRLSGETLLRLLNDILDLSKIEARKLGLELIDFDLHHTFQQAVEMVAIKAHEKGLEVVCRIEPEVPALLRGDPGRLCQVLVNLAGNAVKFTPKGQVLVRVGLESEDGQRVRIGVEVEDTGIGIPANRLGTLFLPFTQVDGSITRQFGGTGLGLAISRELVEMMGGTIGVRSELGKGSCFNFSVLLEKQMVNVANPPSHYEGFQGLRVLVVDDNEANTALLKHALEGWGCRFESAKTAGAALELLGAAADALDHFRVVLLDYMLPGTDVAELALQIRNVPAPQELRLILMKPLGYGDGCSRPPAGCCSSIYKPIRTQQLYECLRTALDPSARRGPSASESKPEPRRLTVAGQSLSILVVEDHPMNQAVILETIKTLGHRADPVGNGYEAIQSLRDIPYHLVLMDCQMPEMDGFEASSRIRAGEAGAQNSAIPIIALTAHARAEDRQKCLLAGMNDYLSKPVRIEEVAAILERWGASPGRLPGKTAMAAGAVRTAMVLAAPLPISVQQRKRFVREKLLPNFMGNKDLARRAIGLFLEDLPKQLSLLKVSIECCNHRACEKVAHRFKGAFAQLGVQLASELASQMEEMAKQGETAPLAGLLPQLESEIAALIEIVKEI